MSTAFLTHTDCNKHFMEGHPERPDRLVSILQQLQKTGLLQELTQVEAGEAADDLLGLVHPTRYLKELAANEPRGRLFKIDPDTYMSEGSLRASKLAAGACIKATTLVLEGKVNNAFCAVRPPGHHTEISQAMGFCLINNVAVAAQVALQRNDIDRVAILDFDVHHCNGTVDIFKDRDEVLVCSSFQENFYPFRYLDYTNAHILNTPLKTGSGGAEFRQALEKYWFPAIEKHNPDIIYISAGFDAHRDDPLGNLNLLEDDYTWATRNIGFLAKDLCEGKIVSTLEGGYNLESLANSVQAHLEALI